MFILTPFEDLPEITTINGDDNFFVMRSGKPNKAAWKNITPIIKRSSITVASSTASSLSKQNADVICNGVSDQDNIMEAINSLSFGGKVQLSEGTFFINSPIDVLHDAISIVGMGTGTRSDTQPEGLIAIGTRIQSTSGFTFTDVPAIIRVINSTRCLGNVRLKDFSISGIRTDTVNGLIFMSHRGLLDNITVSNCGGDGIIIKGIPNGWSTFDTFLRSIIVDHNVGNGIVLGDRCYDIHIVQAVVHTNDKNGILIEGSSEQIEDLHTYSNKGHNVIFTRGTGTKINNWKSENAGMNGLCIDSSTGAIGNICVSNFNMKNNSSLGDGLYSDIYLGSLAGANAVNNAISNGTFFNIQSTILPKYHIEEDVKSQGNNITNVTYSPTSSRQGVLSDKGSRNLFNNSGKNGGVPGVTGAWSSEFKEGAVILDTSLNGKIYLGIGGMWKPLT